MMKSNHEEVCFVMSEEVDDGVHLLAFKKMSLEFDSFAQCGLARLGMQSFIGLCTITVDDQLQRRVSSVGIGRVSGRRLKDGYCSQFGAQCLGQVNCGG
jgi:hypothetical protein